MNKSLPFFKTMVSLCLLLWAFNGMAQTKNTWVSGSNTVNQRSTYGTQGVGSTSNIPVARYESISWSANDTLWLFGGYGYDGAGNFGCLNDLWKFNKVTQEWTWVSGTITSDQQGTYGTKGTGSTSNIPGTRHSSISWKVNNTLWLFGGYGDDGAGNFGYLNDLWKFNMTTQEWTWVSGSNTRNQQGTYGTKGVGSISNIPGARQGSISWIVNNTLWLFGGDGYDGAGNFEFLNDLWNFNMTTQEWTWVSGSNTKNQQGTYGTKGVGSIDNTPGAKRIGVSWTDNDYLWLFGGDGKDESEKLGSGYLNDLWKFNISNGQWTWVSGSSSRGQKGTYGTQGVGSTSNIPGARLGSISWIVNNTLWLFGGYGYDGAGNSGYLNDLWNFNMTTQEWTWVSGSNTKNQQGTYGTKGVGSTENSPGARREIISWKENDNLWLFGGFGYDGSGRLAPLNDLWKFNY